MISRICKLWVVLALAATPAAAELAVVLTNDVEHTRIAIAEYPGNHDAFVVAWKDVPGATPASGAMVYYRDKGGDEVRYFAVGGGGRFAIVDRGRHRLVRGSAMPIAYVISDDPTHPLAVVADDHQQIDVPALVAQYAAFENIAGPSETKASIESAIAAKAAQTNRACGSHVAPKLDWKSFATPASFPLAKQTVSILEALELVCTDKDFAAAVRGVTELRVGYRADGGALHLDKAGTALAVQLSDASFNPRETTSMWLKDHL